MPIPFFFSLTQVSFLILLLPLPRLPDFLSDGRMDRVSPFLLNFFFFPRRPCDPRFETINLHIWGHQNVADLVHTLKTSLILRTPSPC